MIILKDYEIEDSLSYKDMLYLYGKYFSLGYLNCEFKDKMALISIICHLTYTLKQKSPDITHYKVIQNLAKDKGLPESFLKALAVVCDDFSYGCSEFITFNLSNKEMVTTAKKLLDNYMPF